MARLRTIGELARETGYSAEWLRRLEARGLLKPQRAGRFRLYDDADRARESLIETVGEVLLMQPNPEADFPLCRVREVARMLGLSERSIYVWVR